MFLDNLSIAITTYRRPQNLNKCLRSIFKQKYHPKYIYIIDNDYQKSAKKIYQRYKSFKNLKYLVESQKSISKARNLALKTCQTKYLAFIDDDCTLLKNWSENAYFYLLSAPKSIFFQGGVKNITTKNLLIKAQQENYKNWIISNIKNQIFIPIGIDTKNIILNLDIIKKYKLFFDPNLPIFEDTDFGFQLNNLHKIGRYAPKMSVTHYESSRFIKTIKKYFFRGKIRFVINRKWKENDNFKIHPLDDLKNLIKKPHTIIKWIINQSFNIGYLIAKKKNYQPNDNLIFIINRIDKSANGERCLKIAHFLKENGYRIELVDSQKIFEEKFKNKNNYLHQPIIYSAYRVLRYIFYKINQITLQSSFVFYLELLVRGNIIKTHLNNRQAKLAIVQYPEDIALSLYSKKIKCIYDLPTIYSLETNNFYITNLEKKIFNQKHPICFHWYLIMNLAKKIKLKPKNGFILNWGCNLSNQTCQYSSKPKIVHIGKLNSPWVNQSLLKKIYDHHPVDIYSYEKPNSKYKIKTRGFMKNLSKLNKYQFGLITITKDKLRKSSFSAKHLNYISYGLPVFCPKWRQDPLLKPATIYYNENNFEKQFKKYSQKKYWNEKHQAAVRIAKKLNWEITLRPILPIIYQIQNEKNF